VCGGANAHLSDLRLTYEYALPSTSVARVSRPFASALRCGVRERARRAVLPKRERTEMLDHYTLCFDSLCAKRWRCNRPRPRPRRDSDAITQTITLHTLTKRQTRSERVRVKSEGLKLLRHAEARFDFQNRSEEKEIRECG
jgi:hypothetical protein